MFHVTTVSTQRRQPGRTDPGQQSDQDEHQHVRTTPQAGLARCRQQPQAGGGTHPLRHPPTPPPPLTNHQPTSSCCVSAGRKTLKKTLKFWNNLCCPCLAIWGDYCYFLLSFLSVTPEKRREEKSVQVKSSALKLYVSGRRCTLLCLHLLTATRF